MTIYPIAAATLPVLGIIGCPKPEEATSDQLLLSNEAFKALLREDGDVSWEDIARSLLEKNEDFMALSADQKKSAVTALKETMEKKTTKTPNHLYTGKNKLGFSSFITLPVTGEEIKKVIEKNKFLQFEEFEPIVLLTPPKVYCVLKDPPAPIYALAGEKLDIRLIGENLLNFISLIGNSIAITGSEHVTLTSYSLADNELKVILHVASQAPPGEKLKIKVTTPPASEGGETEEITSFDIIIPSKRTPVPATNVTIRKNFNINLGDPCINATPQQYRALGCNKK